MQDHESGLLIAVGTVGSASSGIADPGGTSQRPSIRAAIAFAV
nr:hypothetical protein [Tanacetum cinerariifolium]